MAISFDKWFPLIREEYLKGFIASGGAAVKFVVADEEGRQTVGRELRREAEDVGFIVCEVDAKRTKIHMIDKLFHEVARQINWDELAYRFVRQLFIENRYEIPAERKEFDLMTIAELNLAEPKLLQKNLQGWLTGRLFRDFEMSQEFRMAMMQLCIAQTGSHDATPFLSDSIKDWLQGNLRLVSGVKEALIFQKINRHNARNVLLSLAHWLRKVGMNGLVLILDVSQYLNTTRAVEGEVVDLYYSVPATLDAYEVLRQFIDATDELEGVFICVLTSVNFVSDEKRGVNRYDALRLRITNEVRDRIRENPFAPLVRSQ
ncbi:MAG TPA: BREX system ATP-binding domain-containing protein [Thermoanaerobaculia bacterium]|nr:BREX system ATP-binding domain-containing protein [Thermoanaerobaculia bacterium]